MKRIYLSVPHLIGLFIATGLLWLTWGFSKIIGQQQSVDLVTAWLGRLDTLGPWIGLLIIFVVVLALSRLQDLRAPGSLSHAMVWPILTWLSASVPRLLNGFSGQSIQPLPLVIELVGFVGAGLILFKAKEMARRDDSSRPDGLAEQRR
jgi:hypothetical protein